MGRRPARGEAGLAEIAGLADVSVATVSRVLRGRPGVTTKTRRSVLAALDMVGQPRPEPTPRALPRLVGVILPPLTTPVFTEFALEIQAALGRQGLMPVLCGGNTSGVSEARYLQTLVDLRAVGAIYVSGQHADTSTRSDPYFRLRDRGLPYVLVNGYRDDLEAIFVSVDDEAGVEMSVSHLVRLGHRRIGLAVGEERYVPVSRRVAGFRRVVAPLVDALLVDDPGDPAAPGIRSVHDLIATDRVTIEGGRNAALRLIARGCTAVICGSDLMALGAVQAARSAGLRVPEDVSVVGCDDAVLIPFTDPPLTTLRQPKVAMADAAVGALVAQMDGTGPPEAHQTFAPELIVRRSSGPATHPRANSPRSSGRRHPRRPPPKVTSDVLGGPRQRSPLTLPASAAKGDL